MIVFGVHGDGRDFMPEWEHVYHSWSFGLAAFAVIAQCVDGVLFLVEARIMDRRQRAYERQEEGRGGQQQQQFKTSSSKEMEV